MWINLLITNFEEFNHDVYIKQQLIYNSFAKMLNFSKYALILQANKKFNQVDINKIVTEKLCGKSL